MVECRSPFSGKGVRGWFNGMNDDIVWDKDERHKIVDGMECRKKIRLVSSHAYCDPKKKAKSTMCGPDGLREDLIRNFGEVGQDCETFDAVVDFKVSEDQNEAMALLHKECTDKDDTMQVSTDPGCQEDRKNGSDKDWGVIGFDNFVIKGMSKTFENLGIEKPGTFSKFHFHFHNTPDVQFGSSKSEKGRSWDYLDCGYNHKVWTTWNRPYIKNIKKKKYIKFEVSRYPGKKGKASESKLFKFKKPVLHVAGDVTCNLYFHEVNIIQGKNWGNECDIDRDGDGWRVKCDKEFANFLVTPWNSEFNDKKLKMKREICDCH